MRIRRRIGEKGQIIIPEIIREYIGIKPGDDVFMEVREGSLLIDLARWLSVNWLRG